MPTNCSIAVPDYRAWKLIQSGIKNWNSPPMKWLREHGVLIAASKSGIRVRHKIQNRFVRSSLRFGEDRGRQKKSARQEKHRNWEEDVSDHASHVS